MNCQHMEKNLIAYLDGKASPSERRKVEAHLAECGECRERAEQFRLLWGVLDEWQAPPPSAGFDAACARARGAGAGAKWFLGLVAAVAPRGLRADRRGALVGVALVAAAEPSGSGCGGAERRRNRLQSDRGSAGA